MQQPVILIDFFKESTFHRHSIVPLLMHIFAMYASVKVYIWRINGLLWVLREKKAVELWIEADTFRLNRKFILFSKNREHVRNNNKNTQFAGNTCCCNCLKTIERLADKPT